MSLRNMVVYVYMCIIYEHNTLNEQLYEHELVGEEPATREEVIAPLGRR